MRKRTRKSFSYGSMWMSEARFLIASRRIRFTSLTTGASSAALADVVDVLGLLLAVTSTSSSTSPTMSSSEGPFSA